MARLTPFSGMKCIPLSRRIDPCWSHKSTCYTVRPWGTLRWSSGCHKSDLSSAEQPDICRGIDHQVVPSWAVYFSSYVVEIWGICCESLEKQMHLRKVVGSIGTKNNKYNIFNISKHCKYHSVITTHHVFHTCFIFYGGEFIANMCKPWANVS